MSAGTDLFADLRHRFAVRLREERAALAAEAKSNAREALLDRAHRLAGIAGMLGAAEVGEAALRLEDTLRAGEDHAEALAALRAAIDHAIG